MVATKSLPPLLTKVMTYAVVTEVSQKPLLGLPSNLVQTFMLPLE